MRPKFLWISVREQDRLDAVTAKVHAILPERKNIGHDVIFLSPGAPWIDCPAIEGGIVGRLYTRDGRHRVTGISSVEQLTIMSTEGASLIGQRSGAYVAFWRAAGEGGAIALRDPSACLPGYHVIEDDFAAVASDIDCLVEAGLLELTPEPAGVAQYLAYPATPSGLTSLAGVGELRPGASTGLARQGSDSFVWRPECFPPKGRADPSTLAGAVDAVLAGLCAQWSAPAIELSGGLDSSIVAAACPEGAGAVALHMVPEAPDADERRYARLVTDRFGMPLHEVPIAYDDVSLLLPPARLTARPTNVAVYRTMDHKLRAARIATDADIVLSGAGGDSVFGTLNSTGLVIDAWRDGGIALARSTIIKLAEVAEVSRWNVARHLTSRLARAAASSWTWPSDYSLLGPAGRAAPVPDARLVAGLSPGRRAYVASLLRMQTILDAHDRVGADDMQFPLMAQPVLEACLAVPAWQWIEDGRDRGVARRAYASRLPAAIIDRRGKGRYDTLQIRAYERARAAIREPLLNGWLADNGLIDRAAVAKEMDRPVTAISSLYDRVMRLWDAESWCQMILGRQRVSGPG